MPEPDSPRGRPAPDVSRQLPLLWPENTAVHAGWERGSAVDCDADRGVHLQNAGQCKADRLMTDRISPEHRSWNMSRIRNRDTKPELIVRSLLHRMGYRFRLHRKDLPGNPDIVLPKYQTVIFVHGCFWHRHKGCKFAYTPQSRVEFWNDKFAANRRRDASVMTSLTELGWNTVIIWECQVSNASYLTRVLARELRRLS